jgi:hypothetical protein
MESTEDPGLDNPVYTALTGAQSRFAQACGQAVRYPADVAPFLALPPDPSATDWVDAGRLVAAGTYVAVQRPRVRQIRGRFSSVRHDLVEVSDGVGEMGHAPRTWCKNEIHAALQLAAGHAALL